MIAPLDQGLKDALQAGAWLATAAGVVLTVLKFWSEIRLGRIQRERELRWRQAEAGKSLNDEMQTDSLAWPAFQMLDSVSREFVLPNGEKASIRFSDISKALDPTHWRDDPKNQFIRDCFDTLFYYMAMMDHYISNTLILYEDVAYPIEYYVPLLAKLRPTVSAYLNEYGLWRTCAFLSRYEVWEKSPGTPCHSEPREGSSALAIRGAPKRSKRLEHQRTRPYTGEP